MTKKAVIVFSGGQDSTTCLIHALPTYDEIHCITFDYGYQVRIETPLMRLNKAEVWALADYHNQLDLVRHHTLTCYNGIMGSGCGECDACGLRTKGLSQFMGRNAEVVSSLKIKLNL